MTTFSMLSISNGVIFYKNWILHSKHSNYLVKCLVVICMLKATTGRVRLFAICTIIDILKYENTKQYMYKTNYVLLHHSRTYTNVYITI